MKIRTSITKIDYGQLIKGIIKWDQRTEQTRERRSKNKVAKCFNGTTNDKYGKLHAAFKKFARSQSTLRTRRKSEATHTEN